VSRKQIDEIVEKLPGSIVREVGRLVKVEEIDMAKDLESGFVSRVQVWYISDSRSSRS
jgi:hypothetical protein